MLPVYKVILCTATSSFLKLPFRTILQRNCYFLVKRQECFLYKNRLQGPCITKVNSLCSSTRQGTEKKHSHHISWILEKFGSVGLLFLIPAAIMYPSTTIDYIVSPLIAIHHYVGIEQVLSDYARPSIVGPIFAKLAEILNLITTGIALIGFILFSKNQMCLGEAVQSLWSIKSKEKSD